MFHPAAAAFKAAPFWDYLLAPVTGFKAPLADDAADEGVDGGASSSHN